MALKRPNDVFWLSNEKLQGYTVVITCDCAHLATSNITVGDYGLTRAHIQSDLNTECLSQAEVLIQVRVYQGHSSPRAHVLVGGASGTYTVCTGRDVGDCILAFGYGYSAQ